MTSRATDVVVIGAGHSGLAMSARLAERGVDHVVLERDAVASSWKTQRWDSFTLLTPNWQTRLPGRRYDGDDPDGFMTAAEIAAFVEEYATVVSAPVQAGTSVERVAAAGGGYEITTDQGPWRARSVVMASGACNLLNPPPFQSAVPGGVVQVDPLSYRNPDELPDGGVLVVGAAATGIQLAEEIHASGRPVLLSVGEHVRMPRTYRGRDIQHWLEAIGRLDEGHDDVPELRKARAVASPQLIGTPERRTLDLNALTDAGVELRGRLAGVRDGIALFSGGLANHTRLADQKLARLLDEIDDWIEASGIEAPDPERPEPTRVRKGAPLTLDLTTDQIRSVVWATGFRPDLSFLDAPVFDDVGRIRHQGGVVDAPGLYLLGAPLLRRRRSSFIHGAPDDSRELADHLVAWLGAS